MPYLAGLVLVLVFAFAFVMAARGSLGTAALLAFASLAFVVRITHQVLRVAQLDKRALIGWMQFESRRDLFSRFFNPWHGMKAAPVLAILDF